MCAWMLDSGLGAYSGMDVGMRSLGSLDARCTLEDLGEFGCRVYILG